MCRFLGALADGDASPIDPPASLLRDRSTGLQYGTLPLFFVCKSALDTAKTIHILDFDLFPNDRIVEGTGRNVRITPKCAFFHIAGGCADISEYLAKRHEIVTGFSRAGQVGFA